MKKLTLLLYLFFSINILAQGEANIWYFGENSGLDFNQCNPIPLTDGMLNNTEGCASISNALGELLFYSDGETIWNKNHAIMATRLKGNKTSSQSALIIPHPGNFYQYFLFVTGAKGPGIFDYPDFNYYVIDMTKNNGLGGLLGGLTSLTGRRKLDWSEKIAAVKGNHIRTSWVVSFVEDDFYAYRVGESGVSEAPTISPANFTTSEFVGYLKISPDGKKIAIAHNTTYYENGNDTPSLGEISLYDFNDISGKVYNKISLALRADGTRPYGVEFSADSKKLYVTAHARAVHYNNINDHDIVTSTLYQFDLSTNSPIPQARTIDSRPSIMGALQLGPDEKIYLAQSKKGSNGLPFLGVINNPNAIGVACNYQSSGITLINNAFYGLPPFNPSIFSQLQITGTNENNEEDFVYSVLDLCDGEKVTLKPHFEFDNATYKWIHNRSIISTSPSITLYSDPSIDNGEYVLEITYRDNCGNQKSIKGEFSIFIHETPNIAEEVTLINCDDDGILDGFTIFNLELASAYFIDSSVIGNQLKSSYYLTLEDAETATNPIDTSIPFNSAIQNFLFVRVEDLNNCGFYDTSILYLEVSTNSIPEGLMVTLETCDDDLENDGFYTFNLFDVIEDIFAEFPDEDNLSIQYYVNLLDAQTDQNRITPAGSYTNETPFSQTIYIRLNSDSGACFGVGPVVNLIVNPIPEFELAEEFVYLCENTSQEANLNTIDANGEYTYTWTNEAGAIIGNDQSLAVSEVGSYSVTAKSDKECSSSPITVTVLSIPNAQIDLGNITIIEENELNTITIISLNDGLNFEYSLDNATGVFQNEPVFEMVTPGLHYIYIRDKLGCDITFLKISILGFPDFFTPNNDGYNDYWNIIGTDVSRNASSNIYIYDRFGKIIFKIDLSSDGWDGTYNGKNLPESDYWFSGIIIDSFGKEQTIKGHFSLIRR